ncbi:proton-translocating NADH-quinone oxidoreductase, chain M [Desulfofarcimen acetoxidans DSM 771]|jgi:NADH-quinone oxidoreductase subunit M|uniref:Proton-translocating NADH-quinone oxidoreductase, chain M n=1 Tax=Desulfofarcimen acetoxidans (strain ATCC 49208 / DSM 771 / KCTC 5769 / VKM B-1644 / 5575) TaxID=485916 RepID=C8W5B6_DESAS|nr:NADH-quinone oxidoreductase subunit M [Desulfofarcimen acetoxidans]ACV62098.1 proton-translocating NADH-quinone oxidoreductase, chain M [Desulfofarcimen acetoxidans DSM 771]
MESPLLLVALLAPMIAALIIVFIPKNEHGTVKAVAALGTFVSLVISVLVYFGYNQTLGGVQYVFRIQDWIKDLGVSFYLGVDGISLPMLLLTNLIGFSSIFASWSIKDRSKEFFILLLVLIAGVMGTFVAQDLFIFLLFYEVVVIPIYILVIIWGSTKRVTKEYAAMKLTIYLLIGSAFLLVGVIALFMKSIVITGAPDFSIAGLSMAAQQLSPFDQIWLFALMLFGFGSLISMWPFHSWSPDGYAGAPTAVSMIHAGVLKKIGGYGLIKIALFALPIGAKFWAPYIAIMGVAGVAYAAMGALAQKDLKYVVGYSSVSHMGYVLLGVASLNIIGVNGAVANMFGHGVMAALFFSMIGFIYEKTHTRWIPDLGGLARQTPRLAVGFMMAAMASLGLPGLVSFIPEFTIFVGSFKVFGGLAVIAIAGIIITALYVLRAGANTLFGPPRPEYNHLQDIKGVELVPLVVLGFVLVLGGFLPSLLFDMINSGVVPLMTGIDSVLQIGGNF